MLASLALAGVTALSGCGLLVVGGAAATTAAVATDRRTAGEQVEDRAIEMKTDAEMRRLFNDRARINATAYAGVVLLTGDVPTEPAKQSAASAAARVEKVVKVVNELRVGDLTPLSVRTNDTWLTSKVKTQLINTKGVPTRTIIVTTERGIVYLLGKVTSAEGQMAATAAAAVVGVNKVVKLFQIISPESLMESAPSAPVEDANPVSTPSSSGSMGDVEALPVQ
jgi:osmotically-inducible protein OsmY